MAYTFQPSTPKMCRLSFIVAAPCRAVSSILRLSWSKSFAHVVCHLRFWWQLFTFSLFPTICIWLWHFSLFLDKLALQQLRSTFLGSDELIQTCGPFFFQTLSCESSSSVENHQRICKHAPRWLVMTSWQDADHIVLWPSFSRYCSSSCAVNTAGWALAAWSFWALNCCYPFSGSGWWLQPAKQLKSARTKTYEKPKGGSETASSLKEEMYCWDSDLFNWWPYDSVRFRLRFGLRWNGLKRVVLNIAVIPKNLAINFSKIITVG